MADTNDWNKSSFGWIELRNFSSDPTDGDSTRAGIAIVGGTLKKYASGTWSGVASGSGANSWDELYDLDKSLTIDSTTLTFAGTHASNDVITVTNASGKSGDCIQITNSGTGKDINGTSSTWSVTKAGVIDATDITTDSITVGSGSANATIDTSGNYDLILTTGNATTADITIEDGNNADIDVTLKGTGAFVINGTTEGSNSLEVDAGDVAVADGSITVTDDDNASSLTVTNATITSSNMVTLTADAATTGSILYIDNGGATLTGAGAYINCNDDGTSDFLVGPDGATTITTAANSTKALSITGIQTSEFMAVMDNTSGTIASDKAILKLDAGGDIAAGSNILRIEATGTPVAGSKAIEVVGTGKILQAFEADVDVTTVNAVQITGSGTLNGGHMLYVDVDTTPNAATDRLVRFTMQPAEANANQQGIILDLDGSRVTALRATVYNTTTAGVNFTSKGALNGGNVLYVTNEGTPAATTDAVVKLAFTGTATNKPRILDVYGTGKDVGGVYVDTDNTTTHGVSITGSGTINGGNMLYVGLDTTPNAASDIMVRFRGLAAEESASLQGIVLDIDGSRMTAIKTTTYNTTTHAIQITGKGALNGGNVLYVTNSGTPAANTDAVANFTFTGTATNNPIVLEVDNGTADAQPLRVNSNVAAATRCPVTIVQDSTTGAKECLELDQDDDDIGVMKLTVTVGAGKTIESADKSSNNKRFVKIDINGSPMFVPAYFTDA